MVPLPLPEGPDITKMRSLGLPMPLTIAFVVRKLPFIWYCYRLAAVPFCPDLSGRARLYVPTNKKLYQIKSSDTDAAVIYLRIYPTAINTAPRLRQSTAVSTLDGLPDTPAALKAPPGLRRQALCR